MKLINKYKMKNLIVVLIMFLTVSCSKNNSNVVDQNQIISNEVFIGSWNTVVNGVNVLMTISKVNENVYNIDVEGGKNETFQKENETTLNCSNILFINYNKNKSITLSSKNSENPINFTK